MTVQEMLRSNRTEVIAKYNSGTSMDELGVQYDCSGGSIWYFLDNNGVEKRKLKHNRGDCAQYTDTVIKFFKNGDSAYAISKKMPISKPTILRILKSNGYDTSIRSKARKEPLNKHAKEIVSLYKKGMSTPALGKKFEAGDSSIWRLLKKEGVELRPNVKYKVDETFFDLIETEEQAYILGWFYSDGCVSEEGRMRIQLQREDRYMLEWIKEQMQYEGPIYDVPPPKKFPWRKSQSCFCVNRKALCDKLMRLGCMCNKSLFLVFPNDDLVPKHLFHHFMRGCFDGDGSVTQNKNHLSASLTSTSNFCVSLGQILSAMNIEYQIYDQNNEITKCLHLTKTEHAKRFLAWLYKDATVYLKRKYNKYKVIA